MVDTRPRSELIQRATTRVLESATIDEALAAVAEVFSDEWEVFRVSCRVVTDDGKHLVVAGVWSAVPTKIRAGLRMSVLASSLPEMVATGTPVVQERPREDATLLDALFAGEGIRSWITVPLFRGPEILGMLSLSSRREGAFLSADASSFSELAAAVAETLLELAAASGNL